MSSPYHSQPPKAFWKQSISEKSFWDVSGLYQPKFKIPHTAKIASGGSCFAQHIGKKLAESGFNYLDYEKGPNFLQPDLAKKYGYNMYSARYGNIYTTRQLLQLVQEAFGQIVPEEQSWKMGDRFADPFRPTIEPDGFETIDELLDARAEHLQAVKKLFTDCDVFVFTLGLTETWVNKSDDMVYPVCPGTAAGEFSDAKYEFKNLRVFEMAKDIRDTLGLIRSVNPYCKFILTVSPVPLVATATNQHVLVATNYSKSALRAVAGQIADGDEGVDYFPSYEVISSHPSKGMFFDPNLRTVNHRGVNFVMEHFFQAHPPGDLKTQTKPENAVAAAEEAMCDEELLDNLK